LSNQIASGIPPEDFELETGYSELTFHDTDGSPMSYEITGNPGLKSALEDSFKVHEGALVAFFVHDVAVDGGANTVYTVRGMRWGRLMKANLKDSATNKGLYIQPVTFSGAGVRTSQLAPSTGWAVGKVVLAR
jgi:hypothetical protein